MRRLLVALFFSAFFGAFVLFIVTSFIPPADQIGSEGSCTLSSYGGIPFAMIHEFNVGSISTSCSVTSVVLLPGTIADLLFWTGVFYFPMYLVWGPRKSQTVAETTKNTETENFATTSQ